MNKRIIAAVLSALMIFSSASVLAGTTEPMYVYPPEYLPGPREHIANAEDCVATQNAVVSEDGIQINAGGSATWGFYLPFHARSLTIAYTGGGSITVTTNNNSYNPVSLEAGTDKEHLIEFGANLGYDKEPQYRTWGTDYGFLRDFAEHSGEKEITITASEGVLIKELRLGREKTAGPNRDTSIVFSTNEKSNNFSHETINTVFVHESAPIVIANGGRRYVDNNDTSLKPQYINGSIYLPINTLAKALHYYNEEIPEKNYVLMRSETHEVVLLNGQIMVTEGLSDTASAPADVITYQDGQYWGAVRYFAELAGKTVAYKDGLIIIDDKYTVKSILEDETYYSYATEKFLAFLEAEEKVGKTYHVAQTAAANDSNSGSALAPFKTIQKASDVAQAGDTIIVHAGTYREIVKPANNGAPNAPITYKAADGENVVISAAEPLESPALYDAEKGIYVFGMNVDMGDGRNQIYVDDELMPEARYPNGPEHITDGRLSGAWGVRADIMKLAGDRSAFAVGGAEWQKKATAAQKENNQAASYDAVFGIYDSADYNTFVSDTLLDQEDDYWKGATYVGTFGQAYALTTGKIASSTKGSITIDDELRNQRWWWNHWANSFSMSAATSQWNLGMIIGHYNAIDMPGEWSKKTDENRMYMMLPEGADPKTIKVEAKARQLVADLSNKKYITLEGFKTMAGGITMDGSEMCMLNGMDMKYISHFTLTSDAHSAYIDFPYDNTKPGAPQRGEVGIYIGGKDNIVVNSVIDHSAAAGLYLTGLYTYVENNIINDTGYMGTYVGGIHLDTVVWDDVAKARGAHAIYNNTVYNSGRHLFAMCYASQAGGTGTLAHRMPSTLGNDVSYNDFHDGSLQALDGGPIYCNGANAGFDRKFTEFSYNYVYKTLTKEDHNHYEALIYWDGNAHGFDTHDNMVFVTGDTGPRMHQYQSLSGNEAYCREWNNQYLGTISLDPTLPVADALPDEYYAEDRPFFAGSSLDREAPYLNNYNRFVNQEYSMQYSAKDAEVSEGVTIGDDGFATFTGDGQWIHFKDVDFGDGADELVLSFRSDAYHTFDEYDLVIGDSLENGTIYFKTVTQHDNPKFEQTCTSRFMIGLEKGKQDVWIRITDYKSVRIGGLNVYKRLVKQKTDDFCYFAYAGNYSDVMNNNRKDFMGLAENLPTDDPNAPAVKSTWGGCIARYRNQVIEEDAGAFVMAAGSRDQYLGQVIRVYLCEPTEQFVKPTGEPVAEFTVLNQTFQDFTPRKIPLLKEVKAGKYDLYLEFVKAPTEKTSGISYFGFLKKGVDENAFSSQVRYQGGKYDTSITAEVEGQPIINEQMIDRFNAYAYMRVYTWPGTILGFSNVNVLSNCEGIELYYSADEGYANQPVTARVVNAAGEEVARGTHITTPIADRIFKTEILKLNNPVPAGNYKVYFDFGGEKGSGQTMRLGYFRFSEKAE